MGLFGIYMYAWVALLQLKDNGFEEIVGQNTNTTSLLSA